MLLNLQKLTSTTITTSALGNFLFLQGAVKKCSYVHLYQIMRLLSQSLIITYRTHFNIKESDYESTCFGQTHV